MGKQFETWHEKPIGPESNILFPMTFKPRFPKTLKLSKKGSYFDITM